MALFRAERKAKNSVLQKQWEVPPKCSSLSCEKYKLRLLKMNHWSMPMWITLIYIIQTRIITYLYTVYIYISFLAERWMRRTKMTKKLRGSWRLPLQQDPRAALFGTRGGQTASTKQTWYTNVYRVCTVSGWIMLNRFLQPIEERKQEETPIAGLQAASIFVDVSEALVHLHRRGIADA
jgi:hypothetical protein